MEREDTMVASQELPPGDDVSMPKHSSESDLGSSTNHDHDVERYPSYESVQNCQDCYQKESV